MSSNKAISSTFVTLYEAISEEIEDTIYTQRGEDDEQLEFFKLIKLPIALRG